MHKQFITRVEMHSSDLATFTRLHIQMSARKFHKTIRSDERILYRLPKALYYSFDNLTVNEVRGLALEPVAATMLGASAEILTAEMTGVAWSGHAPEVASK